MYKRQEFWLDVGSAVGDGGVSGGQLQVGDTVGEKMCIRDRYMI